MALVADISSDSWLIRIWFFLKSPNCPSSSLNAKVVWVLLLAGFEFMHWIIDKGDSEKLQTIPQDQHHCLSCREILWENRIFQREEAQSVQKNHIYLPAKCFTHLQCWDQICLCMSVFQKKSLGFSRLVVEYVSANQPDEQIRYASICTKPGHKPWKKSLFTKTSAQIITSIHFWDEKP